MKGARFFLMLVAGLCAPEVLLAVSTGDAQPEQANRNRPAPAAPARPILDWKGVESDDYRDYVNNLQAIGCPTQTIRDIVLADVVGAYATKREAALAVRYENFKYWKSDASETAARARLASQRQVIDEEMNGVLKALLGEDINWVNTGDTWKKAELGFELAFLPAEKRQFTIAIVMASARVDVQIKELAAGLCLTDDTNELQHILQSYDEKQLKLQQLLSPEEYKLVEMTTSSTAENLRRAMVNFEPTETEFRLIFETWQSHDEKLARIIAARGTDPGNAAVYAHISEQLTKQRYQRFRDTWWK